MSETDHKRVVELDVPNVTIGDLIEAQGAIFDAAITFVDWEALHNGAADAVSPAGRILLQIAARLPS